MDFARQQRNPTKHMVGIAVVILVHVLVIYALLTGLARKAVEVIKKPLTATIIEEVKLPPPPPPPPPPPKKVVIEQPKIPPPPVQPYVPPPDIPTPAPAEPVIAAPTVVVPTEPNVIAPPPPPAPPAPKPSVRKGLTPVEIIKPQYPREAIRAGIQSGKVVALLSVDEKGNVTDVRIKSSEPQRVFDREVIRTLAQWKFIPDGEKYVAEVEINFTLKDE
jgi:periplasmic protein TonB